MAGMDQDGLARRQVIDDAFPAQLDERRAGAGQPLQDESVAAEQIDGE